MGDVGDLDVFDDPEDTETAVAPRDLPQVSAPVQVGGNGQQARAEMGHSAPSSETASNASQRTIVGAINMNTSSIRQNEDAIRLNSVGIEGNSLRISSLESQYVMLNDSVRATTRRISDVEGGLAAVSSMPDLYLEKGEKMSAAASIGGYDDNIGFGTAIAVRANQNWTFGLTAAHANGHSAGKLQARIGW
ncbi:hypothetical protein [Henriciella marina]|uniref:hypothetical protein n=1 Tax=Henriciella marina TaxID=453851 RepID=UPI000686DBAC|nr:hypothetical protein [Henriciella marina]